MLHARCLKHVDDVLGGKDLSTPMQGWTEGQLEFWVYLSDTISRHQEYALAQFFSALFFNLLK